MKRITIFNRMLLLAFVACLPMIGWAQFSGSGSGTETDPYLIYNEMQLYQMNNFLGDSNAGVVFKLMKDLDLTDFISENFPSEGWMPVGVESAPFKGKLYGNNHSVSGFFINRSSIEHVGFFGYISSAVVKDFSLKGSNVIGSTYVGSIIGKSSNSTISNVTSSISSSANFYCGGICGYAENTTIESCNLNGKIKVSSDYCGGICGYAQGGSISLCGAVVNITGGTLTGGVVGESNGTNIINCNISGPISGISEVGGIVGCANSSFTISNSKHNGDIISIGNVGGIAGRLLASSSITFTNCHSKGKITSLGDYVGGGVGISLGARIEKMEGCSHFGDISGKNYVGGLVGCIEGSSIETKPINDGGVSSSINNTSLKFLRANAGSIVSKLINNCASVGNITGEEYIGGLIGSDQISVTSNTKNAIITEIKNSYFSGEINGTSKVGGIVGYKEGGAVQYCYTNASVHGASNVGGIVGSACGSVESQSTLNCVIKSNVAINSTISATDENVGRIYGSKENDYVTIGALASAEGNRALTTTKVIKQGVVQEIKDDLQNGNVMGISLLKLKANYVALGWDMDNYWNILETECFPYKKYQTAPPVIKSDLISQSTEINGSSSDGGTVFLYYKNREAVSTKCVGNSWSFTTEKLQSGATVQLYADADSLTPSYLTSATVKYPGSGTETDPYLIYSAEDLQGTSNKGYYKLMNDIDLSDWINENSPTEGWISIGRNSGEATYFDGAGYKITGLWINSKQNYSGLFSNFSAGITTVPLKWTNRSLK